MKRLLLGTTALVGGILVAGSAMAQLELTISGRYYFQAAFIDDEAGSGADDFGTKSGGEIAFNADAVADNGLEYGFELEIDDIATDTGTDVDEAYGYASGNWGYLRFGDKDGANDTLAVKGRLTAGVSFIDSDFNDYLDEGGISSSVLFDTAGLDGGDDTKITYLTTGLDLGGFTAGVSWTPNVAASGENDSFNTRLDDGTGDAVDVAANWQGSFSGVDVAVGATYFFGEGDGLEDAGAWTVGLNVGYGGFTLGAIYIDNSDSYSAETAGADGQFGTGIAHDNWKTYNVGLTYETGPWEVGVAYSFSEVELTDLGAVAVTGDREEQRLGGGVGYTVAPGLQVRAEAGWFDFDSDASVAGIDDDAGLNNDGFVGMLTTQLTF